MLAVGSVVVGVVFASLGVSSSCAVSGPNYFPRMQEIALGGPVRWLLAGLTVTSGLMFGLVPALHGTGGPVGRFAASLGRSVTGSLAFDASAACSSAANSPFATPLLVVAGLLLASLNELQAASISASTAAM